MIPIVFVHGFLGGSLQWQAQCAAFGDVETYCVDLPGFGENAHLDGFSSIAEFAGWVVSHLASQGINRFHLVGHSMGGMIAQEIIAQAPDCVVRLVLYGTGAQGVLPGRFETIATSKQRAVADGPKATARRIAATWFLDGDGASAYEPCASIAERSRLPTVLAGLDAMKGWNGAALLGSIEADTLIVWGDQDRTYPWAQIERLWQSIPNANLAVLPNCAHAAHLEKPWLFNEIIKDFLTR
ncbi:MAG: alpha/beta fold hydrolase [Paracoccaceae bacterium]